jgi:hypothetical protein
MTSDGKVGIGGTLPASPNISLNADGSGTFVGVTAKSSSGAKSFLNGDGIYQNGTDGVTNVCYITNTGDGGFAGDVKIGGTLPASPNIQLKADGNADFAKGNIVLGSLSSGGYVSANRTIGNTAAFQANLNGTATAVIRAEGSAYFPSAVGVGSNQSTPEIALNANGSATFAGKVTSASTESGDAGTTLATKDYVDARTGGGGGAGGVGTVAIMVAGRSNTPNQDWYFGDIMTNISDGDLTYCNTRGAAGFPEIHPPAGSSWQCLGYSDQGTSSENVSLWQRIS